MNGVRGFRYDAKTKRAFFEVVIPGTGSRRRRRKWTTAPTRADALSAWKAFRDDVLHPTPTTTIPTLDSYVQDHWPSLTARVSPRTARDETYLLRRHLLPTLGNQPLMALNAAIVHDLAGTLRQQEYSPASVNAIVSLLVRLLHDAVTRGVIDTFPIRGRLPKQRVPILHLELTTDERRALLGAFENEHAFREYLATLRGTPTLRTSEHYQVPRRFGESLCPNGIAATIYYERFRDSQPAFLLALDTGLRRGDLLDLRWRDIHDGWVRRTLQKTKTTATVPLSTAAITALDVLRHRGPTRGHDHVLRTTDGTPYDTSTINRYWMIAKRLAGITRRCRFHDLRHTFASTLASKGVSLQVISQAMGHTTCRMTERYARPDCAAAAAVKCALDGYATEGN